LNWRVPREKDTFEMGCLLGVCSIQPSYAGGVRSLAVGRSVRFRTLADSRWCRIDPVPMDTNGLWMCLVFHKRESQTHVRNFPCIFSHLTPVCRGVHAVWGNPS
jgi:hypothetical protein